MIAGLPCNQNSGFGAGLAAGNPMAVEGIKASDNLIAVISWVPSTGFYIGREPADFTVAAGTIQASTTNLSAAGTKFVAIWTDAPDS